VPPVRGTMMAPMAIPQRPKRLEGQEAGMTDASVVRMSVRQDASKLRGLGLS